MIKNTLNWIVFFILFFVIVLFSIENDNLMILNLFPFKVGIEMPVYLYTLTLAFISFITGIIFSKLFYKSKNIKGD